MTRYSLTIWPSLFGHKAQDPCVCQPQRKDLTLPELATLLTTHITLEDKLQGQGFGPYTLRPGATHREDRSIQAMTLAVFDVDVNATFEAVLLTRSLLRAEGLAQVWYSTYNHGPDTPSHRLVIPLERPMDPTGWPEFRRQLLTRYKVPADPTKCSGRSHFYFLPAHRIGATPEAWSEGGRALVPPDTAPAQVPTFAPGFRYEPPPEPTQPVDLEPLRERLRERMRSLRTSTDPKQKQKGTWLQRAIDGEPLDGHGSRDEAATVTCAVMVWALPENTPASVIRHLVRPSIEAMIAAGSTLTLEAIDRKIRTAMEKRAVHEAEKRALLKMASSVHERDLTFTRNLR